jgi:hypothetical protein
VEFSGKIVVFGVKDLSSSSSVEKKGGYKNNEEFIFTTFDNFIELGKIS